MGVDVESLEDTYIESSKGIARLQSTRERHY